MASVAQILIFSTTNLFTCPDHVESLHQGMELINSNDTIFTILHVV